MCRYCKCLKLRKSKIIQEKNYFIENIGSTWGSTKILISKLKTKIL